MSYKNLQELEVFRLSSYRNFDFNGQSYLLNTYPYMDIILGDACNCKCKFCVADLIHDKLKLNVEMATKKIAFANKYLGVKEFLILGGEPTIYGGLFDIVSFIKYVTYHNKICLTTNGHRMSSDFDFAEKVLSSGITHLNISVMSLDRNKQKEINNSKYSVSKKSFETIKFLAETNGVVVRFNNNSFVGNNDTLESVVDFYDNAKQFADIIKISSLLQTDSFSTIDNVSNFTKKNKIPDEEYNKLFRSIENYFKTKYGCGLIRNYDTLGFVENSLLNMDVPLIFNYNHTGRLMKEFVENKKINGFKLLPNGEISISWNRERKDLYIKTED